MQFAFSTLGCPDVSWEDMLVIAKDLGFDGIEVRGVGSELFAPRTKPFSTDHIDSTMKRLESLKLEIPCLTSACHLFDQLHSEQIISEAKEYIKLASRLGVKYLRLLGDSSPEPGIVDEEVVVQNSSKLLPFATQHGVTLLIETNGVYANSDKILNLIDTISHPNLQVLWDVHHTSRFFNEDVEFTLERLFKHIRFVHIKDSVTFEGKIKYKMMGKGDIPVSKALEQLSKRGYQGFVSLEWVKRFNIELEEPGIVFSQFINFVSKFK